LKVTNTFSKSLPADNTKQVFSRVVEKACFSFTQPQKVPNASMVHWNQALSEELDTGFNEEEALAVLSGNKLLSEDSYAMCYGGHQFGNWAGQLGDGRAINLFDADVNGKPWTFQLKGAGPTPYSRSADGYAVLRSSIREYLMSEAMFHLGVPTTRAMSLVLSGEKVERDMFYNGNRKVELGAIVSRLAPSFIRFGNFQILAARKETEILKSLVDYTLDNHFPEIEGREQKDYLAFFKEVSDLSLEMVVHWQRVGFVHGVMNTDNMSILGLTIDYGPYGWMDNFDSNWTPNTTDANGKRYRFGNQPEIVLWNLLQLANAIYPLIGEAEPLEKVLHSFQEEYHKAYFQMMSKKLGLLESIERDKDLIESLENLMQSSNVDMTVFYRLLADLTEDMSSSVFDGWNVLNQLKSAFYEPDTFSEKQLDDWNEWLMAYTRRLSLQEDNPQARKHRMDKVNPKYVLRNYMAQLAIEKAEQGDYSLKSELFDLIQHPYAEQQDKEEWFAKRPDWAKDKPGSSMLSCSS
jgi:uncharacterized protein YdiU (UPF0061 family)